jgi:hypothetical protein
MSDGIVMEATICNSIKCGEYNTLRCARVVGHRGDHGYVVADNGPLLNSSGASEPQRKPSEPR